MRAWEQSAATVLRAIGLESIQRKILVFGIIATLVPSLGIAWVSYAQNKRALTDKIAQELGLLAAPGASGIELWRRQHLFDLRVFAGSELIAGAARTGAGGERRRADYLASVRSHYADYDALAVLDLQGRVVAVSSRSGRSVPLPADWQSQLRTAGEIVGEPYRGPDGKPMIVLAMPIRSASGRGLAIGTLAAVVDLHALTDDIRRYVPRDSGRFFVTTGDGLLIAGVAADSLKLRAVAKPLDARLTPGTMRGLTARPGEATEYGSFGGRRVVGTLEPVERLNWAVLAEVPSSAAFRQIAHLRNVTLGVVTAMFVSVGLLAYVLGLLIIHPLNRLAQGAATVAEGDLAVDIPVIGGGEVGRLTTIFNHMVDRLREGREALERLTVTDGLTGLFNRRRLMETLAVEAERSQRGAGPFTVLMIDVDHFKQYNDSHGHQAGDTVLSRVAEVLRDVIRQVDTAARYGGEEFLLLLPQTSAEAAVEVAERLRKKVSSAELDGERVTVSVGVAEYPGNGDTVEGVIAAADAALYRAKMDGRDRVVRSSVRSRPSTTARRRRDG